MVEIEHQETIEKTSGTKSWFFEKKKLTNKNDEEKKGRH